MTNELFSRRDWHDDANPEAALGALLNPVRIPYIEAQLARVGGVGAARVLDIGAGGGLVAVPLAHAGADVVGVDIAIAPLLGAADQATLAEFVVGSGAMLPFADGVFDAVLALEVLEHVPCPGRVVSEAARVLRPGGVLIAGGPNRTMLSSVVLIWLAQVFPPTRLLPADLHRWRDFVTPAELARMQAAVGIDAVDTVGVGLGVRQLPTAARAGWQVKTGRITYAKGAARARLTATDSRRLAFMSCGLRR